MSESNLAAYDYELLSRIKSDLVYIGRDSYNNKPLKNHKFLPIFTYYKKAAAILKLTSYFKNLLSIGRLVKIYRPGVLHVQWMKFPPLDYIFYKYLKQKYQIKLVYTAHNLLPHDSGNQKYNQYLKLYELSDAIIVHTETAATKLSQKFGIKRGIISVAPHGPIEDVVDREKVDQVKNYLVKQYRLHNKIVFSLLGIQSKYKGSDIAVSSWRKAHINNAVLILGGEASDPDLFVKPEDGMIVIPRRLSAEEMCALFELTDCLLLPYREIEQSGVLLTAIMKEIPFAATNVGELQKPIEYGNVGWKLSDDVENSLIKLFENISKSPDIINSIRANANWHEVKRHYSWNYSAEVTSNLYASLI